MQRRSQCKFFAQGACLKGESCDFVHDSKMTQTKKACIYYQRGSCRFGSRCKFEHSWAESSATFSPLARGPPTSIPPPVCTSSGSAAIGTAQNPSVNPVLPSVVNNPIASGDSATVPPQKLSLFAVLSDLSIEDNQSIPPVKPDIPIGQRVESGGDDRKICSLAADGNCPLGESCSDIHGDLCATCGKHCLHPFKPEDREKHAKECKKKQALERSQEIECSVCLERVLSKTSAFERKFGLLSECDHAFCIACIKKWRSSSSSSLFEEGNSAARACPICRKVSYYVIPSPIWHSSTEEKQEIINQYKAKLKSIDCRYFNFGNGSCRHGSSCFYKHEVKPGSSRHSRSSNANYRRNNRQHRGRWDDDNDHLGFGDLVEMAALDAMLGDFEDMFFLSEDTEEAVGDGAPGDEDEVPEPFMNFLKKQIKWQMLLSGDYDEEDLLEPWERDFMYGQLGYDDYDDYLYCQNYGHHDFDYDYDSEDDE